uniref:Isochorismatase-like domain-containing protein n=2 Tax=Lotharella globosa TaxID=91324 RepID=A0A7S3ZIJ7_9EUKA
MMKAATELKMPIIVTEQYPKGLGETVGELQDYVKNSHKFEKTQFSMLTAEVKDCMEKKCSSCDTWIIVGIESHVCVQQTALGLLKEGKSVYVLADAVSSQTRWDREIALDRMRQAGAVVTTTESCIFELLGDFKHPSAKGLSKRRGGKKKRKREDKEERSDAS